MNIKQYAKYTKSISQYFGASFIPMLISLAINPLVALNMDPDDYAITGYYTSFSTFFSPLIVFYMLHYFTRKYYELDELGRTELRATLVKALIFFSGCISLFCLLGLFIYINFFNKESDMPFSPYAILTVLTLPITGIYSLMLTDLKMQRKSGGYLKLSLIASISLTFFTIIFVVLLKWGAMGKLLAPFVTNMIFFVLACYYYKDSLRIPFNKRLFKEMLVFCYPLTLAAMLNFFSNGYDRVYLERLGDNNELGYYSVGVQMAGYISIFQSAIGNTFQPDLFQAIAQKNKNKILKIILLLVGSTACVVVAYILVAPFVVKILTAGRYMMSVKYTQIIALSVLTSAMYFTVSQITVALGKSKITLVTKIITTIFSVMMFSYLIDHFAFIGAAWGMVLSFVVCLFVNLILLWLSFKYSKHDSLGKRESVI